MSPFFSTQMILTPFQGLWRPQRLGMTRSSLTFPRFLGARSSRAIISSAEAISNADIEARSLSIALALAVGRA